ncbi:MAG: tRNA (adenosine(37)-N6)-dimethylallyltransferase MiaA [Saprospiraceae bacterium]|nr:tRNA (adenosine(37)-N6)-dimethylallyltransferase MiaA [Saprospiraceae bacterium]MCB9322480.1 tRNA (adenosine(37)-N6)-dimethylallyltransferase MiaA [Lewinellaceae bacterium]
MSANKYLIVLGGPTASGKTSFAIELARHYQTEIVSCDSRQFYREMTIGTAKPTLEEQAQVKHHFINSLSIEDDYSVGDFEKEALVLLEDLFRTRDYVVMSGGSGLFINAVCFGLDAFPEVPERIRKQVEADFEEKGIGYLQEALKTGDPEYYEQVDLQNPHRLMRAIEVIRATAKPFSSFRKGKNPERSFKPIFLQMHHTREVLYQRINTRVDGMMAAGLLEEVNCLLAEKHLNGLQTVGYQELIAHFEAKLSLEKAVELIKQNSRRYAKRQITWMRRDGFWKHFRPEETEMAFDYISLVVQEKLRLAIMPSAALGIEVYTMFPQNTKVLAAFNQSSLKAYLAFEIHPKKTVWYNPVILEGDQQLETILNHEARLLREEMGK